MNALTSTGPAIIPNCEPSLRDFKCLLPTRYRIHGYLAGLCGCAKIDPGTSTTEPAIERPPILNTTFVKLAASLRAAAGVDVWRQTRRSCLTSSGTHPARPIYRAPIIVSGACSRLSGDRSDRHNRIRVSRRLDLRTGHSGLLTAQLATFRIGTDTRISRRSRSMSVTRSCSASSSQQSAAIHERADQPDLTLDMGQKVAHFFPVQHHREVDRPCGAH